MGNLDLTILPRKKPTAEIRERLEAIVFTATRDWQRSLKIDRYVRDILVHALKLDEDMRKKR